MKLVKFQSENLVVDYISFNITGYKDPKPITTYLFDSFGFNSVMKENFKGKSEDLIFKITNKYKVSFVKSTYNPESNSYWTGMTVKFSGENGKYFYSLIRRQLIDWCIFDLSCTNLGRFDLYYSRNNKRTDRISVQDFCQNCQTKLKQIATNVTLEKNSKGIILKIGHRASNQYSRIYQTRHSLKFEYEIKGKLIQDYHSLLITNNFEEFEDKLANHFLSNFAKLLPLNYPQVDWLVQQLRPIRKQQIPISEKLVLNSHYLQIPNSVDHKKFVNFLQFLSYARTLDFTTDYLGDIRYRQVVFKLQDFLKFQTKSTGHYHVAKVKNFFEELQSNFLITSFSDSHFQSLVTIPQVTFEKTNQNFWIAKIWIVEELFYYHYPFMLPNFFIGETTKDRFAVQFKMIQTFSSVEIEKIFLIQQFFQDYPSALSNQRKAQMKQYFIELVQILQEYDLIETNYKVISNGKAHSTDQLNTANISEGFIIYEKLDI